MLNSVGRLGSIQETFEQALKEVKKLVTRIWVGGEGRASQATDKNEWENGKGKTNQ